MTILHIFISGATLTFAAIVAKFWWDLRDAALKLNKRFRDETRECTEEYWSRYVYAPINSFFTTASRLMLNQNQDYANLQDILLDGRHGPGLEESVTEAAREIGVYVRLGNLSNDIRPVIKSQRSWSGGTVLSLLLLFVFVAADFINQVVLKPAWTGGSIVIDYITTFCFVFSVILASAAIYCIWRARGYYNEYQESLDFYLDCQERIENE